MARLPQSVAVRKLDHVRPVEKGFHPFLLDGQSERGMRLLIGIKRNVPHYGGSGVGKLARTLETPSAISSSRAINLIC